MCPKATPASSESLTPPLVKLDIFLYFRIVISPFSLGTKRSNIPASVTNCGEIDQSNDG